MKLKSLFLGTISLALLLAPITNAFATDVQDFYFEDFAADYYLTKLEDGTSKLHVKEVATAIFPDIDQNHGITRMIPFTNQDGENYVVKSKEALNFTVLRNGEPEKISRVDADSNGYTMYIGDANVYVHGKQVYTMEYDFYDVIMEFDESGKNVSGEENATKLLQRLYWDTNGTGTKQRIDTIRVRLHTTDDILKNMDDTAWCYVGKYGQDDKGRCTIVKTSDGFEFTAETLTIGENLTFATEFKPNTFVVMVEKNYILVIVLAIEIIIVLIILLRKLIKWNKYAKPQYKVYRDTFVVPQYLPPKNSNIHVAEGEQIYLKRVKPSYVATLLELAVAKAISIKKLEDEKKSKWGVVLNVDPKTLSSSQKQVLNILSGDGSLTKNDYIPVKKHKATSFLAGCAENYKDFAFFALERDGYMQKEKMKSSRGGVVRTVVFSIGACVLMCASVLALMKISENSASLVFLNEKKIIVGEKEIPFIVLIVLVVFIVINSIIKKRTNKYIRHTEEGVILARYLEGLELYIKMAEADRLKFLQSVDGADTSNEGIVKLYEKLLPWASLFGAEKSWVKELAKYYEVSDIQQAINTDVIDGIAASSITYDIANTIRSSVDYTEPSSTGSSWSSSDSGSYSSSEGGGSSGGGYSGGGGGGGGLGGW